MSVTIATVNGEGQRTSVDVARWERRVPRSNPMAGRPGPSAQHADSSSLGELADAVDTNVVTDLIAAVLAQGNGASFQRAAY